MIVYAVFSVAIGIFMSVVWQTNDAFNTIMKCVWIAYTIASVIVLLSLLFPDAHVNGTAIRIW
jgi:hypothetical protein